MSLFSSFKRYFQDKIGIGENRDRISFLEKKIDYGHTLLQQLLPEILEFPPSILEERRAKWESWNISPTISDAIHKNDLMFRYPLLHHSGNLRTVLDEYDKTGKETAFMLREKSEWTHTSGKTILDFGGGHGRVSRFLPHYFPDADIYVSEVKESALRFQKEVLGHKIIAHTDVASSFHPEIKFDLIFAGSVFTHLNRADFETWARVLIKSLSPDGMLIFSVHNTKDLSFSTQADFLFTELTEDQIISEVEDRLSDSKKYGVSYVSEAYLRGTLHPHPYAVHRKSFGGTQDLVILQGLNQQ